MAKFLKLSEVGGSHTLGVPLDMSRILNHPDLVALHNQFGSELIYRRGDTSADIEPPIPSKQIYEYGRLIVALAQRFEPEQQFQFQYNSTSNKKQKNK